MIWLGGKGVWCVLDFVEDGEQASLLSLIQKLEKLVIVCSLTKFFALPGLRLGYRATGSGTINFLKGPAMSQEVAIEALLAGYEETVALINQGYQVIGTGEMGIGNTTISVVVIAAILGMDSVPLVGYGAGLDQQGLSRKTEVVLQALKRHAPSIDALDAVAKVGSLDILGIAGSFLACTHRKKVAVVDGLISITGLLVASRLQPTVLDYVFYPMPHQSQLFLAFARNWDWRHTLI